MTDNSDKSTPQEGSNPPRKSNLKRAIKYGAIIVGLVAAFYVYRVGSAAWILYRHGILSSSNSMRQYHGDRQARLKAIQVALMQYQDSEGQFPNANGWMTAIENRIQSDDMTSQQSNKKLQDPSVPSGQGYGFGFNQALSGKYLGDIKDPSSVILVYTSKDVSKNASGIPDKSLPNPPRDGENLGITVSGKIVKL